MQPPLEADPTLVVVAGQPGLRPVHVTVDGHAEMLVERGDDLGRNRPDRRRNPLRHWSHGTRPLRWPGRAGRVTEMGAAMGTYDRLTALDARDRKSVV